MGRRKSKRKPPPKRKNIEPLDQQFNCPFCNHEKSCEVKIGRGVIGEKSWFAVYILTVHSSDGHEIQRFEQQLAEKKKQQQPPALLRVAATRHTELQKSTPAAECWPAEKS
ncbi:uncharacterized protein [Drosophila kikkawai]|uniref:Transcription elongation factor 1 homolog n=1 Tax=Drosophila kikkawai TaxID=30033 RepID=A0ABM4GE32_DROKI